MIDNLVEITRDKLLGEVENMMYEGFRFVTATCVDCGNGYFDVYYHFDKDLVMKSFKITVGKDEEVPSISKVYFCSVLVENEMKELFGLNVTNILLDYEGHMLLSDDAPDAPMAKQQIIIEEKGDKKNG